MHVEGSLGLVLALLVTPYNEDDKHNVIKQRKLELPPPHSQTHRKKGEGLMNIRSLWLRISAGLSSLSTSDPDVFSSIFYLQKNLI